ncbi:MAG: Efflux ABC transporter, ATP-binding protein [uncultured Thermomicrobiales bacterium]|uniref:Efflux ABC transporter, ATP-binding protein n=1 Tax=uncultured Thermomicrobiales bacterium TaxID=1645740 RepID=A0A6J4U7H1_9BACT|nr:MAG: Efflux ABC transporter, ATP-binding protein [uncultured Thermomicrobiales bacterium]
MIDPRTAFATSLSSTTSGPPGALVLDAVSKRYGSFAALDRLSLDVPHGIIQGFLGPNGAGKTTAIRILMGFLRASSGSASIFGLDSWTDGVQARQRVGYLVTADALYPDMDGIDQLDFATKISGRDPVLRGRALDALELSQSTLMQRLGSYSKGMRQKLAIVAAMQHDPDLLVLDEPSDGLDPLIQQHFEALLQERRQAGRTVFMSSHDLAEVERTCERVAVIRRGQLVANGTVEELSRHYRRTAVIRFQGPIPDDLSLLGEIEHVDAGSGTVRVRIGDDINSLIRALAQVDISHLAIEEPQLQDIFFGFYDGTDGTSSGLADGAGR